MKPSNKLSLSIACLAIVAATVAASVFAYGDGPMGKKPLSVEDHIRELKRRADKLETEREKIQAGIASLEAKLGVTNKDVANAEGRARTAMGKAEERLGVRIDNSPPVGSVVAYAGPWPPEQGVSRKAWEEKVGWGLCDGTAFDRDKYRKLHAILKEERLPNYQGMFLRGLDPTGEVDKDRAAKDRYVGSPQADAVGPHKHPVTVVGGDHDHGHEDYTITARGTNNNEDDNKRAPNWAIKSDELKNKTTKKSGNLTMSGKSENPTDGSGSDTRPKNIAVNYLIKMK